MPQSARRRLFICTGVIPIGYLIHLIKIIADSIAPPDHWGALRTIDFISAEDYLPFSFSRIDEVWALLAAPAHWRQRCRPAALLIVPVPVAQLFNFNIETKKQYEY